MLEPKPGDYQAVQDIIEKHEEKVVTSGKPFDPIEGWGHVITPPDRWISLLGREGNNATRWEWHGDFADQGRNLQVGYVCLRGNRFALTI